jgi:hypothetical protein
MDPERTMEFILNQQAKHEVEIAELRSSIRDLTGAVAAMGGRIDDVALHLKTLAELQARHHLAMTESITALSNVVQQIVLRVQWRDDGAATSQN